MDMCEWVDRDTQEVCGAVHTARMTILSWTLPHPSRPDRVARSTTKSFCPVHREEALAEGWHPAP
jgi:hypothetical protein